MASLFHPRVLEKHTTHIQDHPEHFALLNQWAENLQRGIFNSETQNDSEFIQKILIDVLGYVGSSEGQKWTVAKNQPVGIGNVDVALGNFMPEVAQIIAPLELKGAKTGLDTIMPARHKTPVQQAWEYAMDIKGAKWVLVSNYREIRLYAVGHGRKNYESFDLTKPVTNEHYARLIALLSAENLLGGKTASLLEESAKVEKEITDELYKDYKALRARLIADITKNNPTVDKLDSIHLAQTILDRILFVAFAEDRGLLCDKMLEKAFTTTNNFNPSPIWDNFKGLFKAINTGNAKLGIHGYNGGLFADNADLNALKISDEICEGFKNIGAYDFDSAISVNILGHIFEQSISDIEELKAQARGDTHDKKNGKRKADGIFYTPPYITQYIVEQAVGGYLAEKRKEIGFDSLPELSEDDDANNKRNGKKTQSTRKANIAKHKVAWEAYKEVVSNIKVLDPACGSGAFLNEVFDFLYREGQTINSELARLHGGQQSMFRWDTHILANNIYGVDINQESVEITKLSLWLKTANVRETLGYLDDNIKIGNSLIDDPAIAGNKAFDWKKEFPKVFANGGFDVVVGNPPYVDSERMVNSGLKEQREYLSGKLQYAKGNWDLYIAFLETAFGLLNSHGRLAFITPDKWIAKPFGEKIRTGLLKNFFLLVECGRDVFEDARVDAIIIGLQAAQTKSFIIARNSDDGTFVHLDVVDKTNLITPYCFDWLLSNKTLLIKKIESVENTLARAADVSCENACATSDCYKLKDFITEDAYDTDRHLKIINTGTISKYMMLWEKSPMKYLKDKYLCPVVDRELFEENFNNSYGKKSIRPKLIMKGLTLLDVCLDPNGTTIPGKSTIILLDSKDNTTKLRAIMALLNSKLPIAYIKEKYLGSTYNQGVGFTTDMIANFPCPNSFMDCVDALAKYAVELEKLRLELFTKKGLFARRLSDNLNIQKITGALECFYKLSFSEFCVELAKQKIRLSLEMQDEWEKYFDRHKSSCQAIAKKIMMTDNEIDRLVYNLYGLTDEEINIVEGDV